MDERRKVVLCFLQEKVRNLIIQENSYAGRKVIRNHSNHFLIINC